MLYGVSSGALDRADVRVIRYIEAENRYVRCSAERSMSNITLVD